MGGQGGALGSLPGHWGVPLADLLSLQASPVSSKHTRGLCSLGSRPVPPGPECFPPGASPQVPYILPPDPTLETPDTAWEQLSFPKTPVFPEDKPQ